MICEECGNLLQNKLYQCIDESKQLCLSCKNEHDESNENKCTWREITE